MQGGWGYPLQVRSQQLGEEVGALAEASEREAEAEAVVAAMEGCYVAVDNEAGDSTNTFSTEAFATILQEFGTAEGKVTQTTQPAFLNVLERLLASVLATPGVGAPAYQLLNKFAKLVLGTTRGKAVYYSVLLAESVSELKTVIDAHVAQGDTLESRVAADIQSPDTSANARSIVQMVKAADEHSHQLTVVQTNVPQCLQKQLGEAKAYLKALTEEVETSTKSALSAYLVQAQFYCAGLSNESGEPMDWSKPPIGAPDTVVGLLEQVKASLLRHEPSFYVTGYDEVDRLKKT